MRSRNLSQITLGEDGEELKLWDTSAWHLTTKPSCGDPVFPNTISRTRSASFHVVLCSPFSNRFSPARDQGAPPPGKKSVATGTEDRHQGGRVLRSLLEEPSRSQATSLLRSHLPNVFTLCKSPFHSLFNSHRGSAKGVILGPIVQLRKLSLGLSGGHGVRRWRSCRRLLCPCPRDNKSCTGLLIIMQSWPGGLDLPLSEPICLCAPPPGSETHRVPSREGGGASQQLATTISPRLSRLCPRGRPLLVKKKKNYSFPCTPPFAPRELH